MPEIVEVMIYERAARRAIGRTIESVVAPDPWFLKGGLDAAAVSATLVGARIEGVDRRGKLLMLLTDRPVVGLRFGMTGRLMVDGDEPIGLITAEYEDQVDVFGTLDATTLQGIAGIASACAALHARAGDD